MDRLSNNAYVRMRVVLPLIPLITGACAPRCVNNVLQQIDSPLRTKIAVLYTRECGATTGPSTNVSVVGRNTPTPQGIGNVVVLKDPVSAAESTRTTRLRWLGADTLEVSLVAGRAVKSRAELVDGVVVKYATHNDRDP